MKSNEDSVTATITVDLEPESASSNEFITNSTLTNVRRSSRILGVLVTQTLQTDLTTTDASSSAIADRQESSSDITSEEQPVILIDDNVRSDEPENNDLASSPNHRLDMMNLLSLNSVKDDEGIIASMARRESFASDEDLKTLEIKSSASHHSGNVESSRLSISPAEEEMIDGSESEADATDDGLKLSAPVARHSKRMQCRGNRSTRSQSNPGFSKSVTMKSSLRVRRSFPSSWPWQSLSIPPNCTRRRITDHVVIDMTEVDIRDNWVQPDPVIPSTDKDRPRESLCSCISSWFSIARDLLTKREVE